MRCPSEKRLQSYLHLTKAQAKAVRKLAAAEKTEEDLRALIEKAHPKTAAYVARMHSSPYRSPIWRVTIALDAINHVMDGYGVESLGTGPGPSYAPPYEFISMGDTYATTLIYKRATNTLSIGSWGDVVEREGL